MVEEKIIGFIRLRGPVLPVKVAKLLGTDILLASAHLSELVSRGKVLISHTKIGGSPVYYLAGQESRLQSLYENLGGKDKRVFNLLKGRKILRDKNLDPLVRVSLRGLKDFAKPLQVRVGEGREVFWKWYLLGNGEAGELIKKELRPKEEVKEKTEVKKVEEKEPIKRKEIEEKKKEEKQKKLEVKEKKKEISQEKLEVKRKKEIKDGFLDLVKRFFEANKIKINDFEIIRKGAEINLEIEVPSVVGVLKYYCKARDKKRCNERDISAAYVEGQLKKLPVLFLYKGELTKKAMGMLGEEFKTVVFKKI